MSNGKVTPPRTKRLRAHHDTVMYEWFTDWQPCAGVDDVCALLKSRGLAGGSHFQARTAIQFAETRTDKPRLPGVLTGDSYLVGAGEHYKGPVDISADADDNTYVRFGVAYMLEENETTPEGADVTLQVVWVDRGSMLGTFEKEVVAHNNVTTQYLPCTPWVPSRLAYKIKVAYFVTGATADLEHRVYYQCAATSVEDPDDPTTLDGWVAGTTKERHTEFTPTTTDKMWVRAGIQVRCAVDKINQQAVISGTFFGLTD